MATWIHAENHTAKLAYYSYTDIKATAFISCLSSHRYPPFSLGIRSENWLDPSEQRLTDFWGCWAHASGTAHLQHVPLWLSCVTPCAHCSFTARSCPTLSPQVTLYLWAGQRSKVIHLCTHCTYFPTHPLWCTQANQALPPSQTQSSSLEEFPHCHEMFLHQSTPHINSCEKVFM